VTKTPAGDHWHTVSPSPSGWDSSAMCCASSLSAHRPAALAIGRWFIRVLSASRRFYMSSCRIAGRVNDRSASQWRVSSLMTDSHPCAHFPVNRDCLHHHLTSPSLDDRIQQHHSRVLHYQQRQYYTSLFHSTHILVGSQHRNELWPPILQLPIKHHTNTASHAKQSLNRRHHTRTRHSVHPSAPTTPSMHSPTSPL